MPLKLSLVLLFFSLNAFAESKDINLKITPMENIFKGPVLRFKVEPTPEHHFNKMRIRIMSENKPPQKLFEKEFAVEFHEGIYRVMKIPSRLLPPGKYRLDVITPHSNILTSLFKKTPAILKGHTLFEKAAGPIIVDGFEQPPHPGAKGEETIAGIDSNNNKIRDDLEIWINETFDDQPSTRLAMKQYSRASEDFLNAYQNKELTLSRRKARLVAVLCLLWVQGNTYSGNMKEYKVELINTSERVRATLIAEDYLAGTGHMTELDQIPSEDHWKYCDFKATQEQ